MLSFISIQRGKRTLTWSKNGLLLIVSVPSLHGNIHIYWVQIFHWLQFLIMNFMACQIFIFKRMMLAHYRKGFECWVARYQVCFSSHVIISRVVHCNSLLHTFTHFFYKKSVSQVWPFCDMYTWGSILYCYMHDRWERGGYNKERGILEREGKEMKWRERGIREKGRKRGREWER